MISIPAHIMTAALLLSLCTTIQQQVHADDDHDTPAGHSKLGESFNEGPRQHAYLIGGTGDIDFPVSTKIDEARAFFNQGVGQLHGYWYVEAERSFRQAVMLDPELAMAYWGMAQANVRNEERARGFLDKAYQRKDKITVAERSHIEAYHRFLAAGVKEEAKEGKPAKKVDEKARRQRYIRDLEQIIFDHPAHIETRALLANFTHLHNRHGVKPTSTQAYEDLMQVVLAEKPLHPVHHFRIHLWDDANLPARGLDAAAKCGPAAPSIAHMWHMPGHIYSKLHRYHDAAWQQEASARVDHRHMLHDRTLPDQTHNYAHNNEWLCRNLMHVGRVDDAVSQAENMIQLPRHPKYNTLAKSGSSASYGRDRLLEALERFEMWGELAAACQSPSLQQPDDEKQELRRLHLLGVAQINLGKQADAEATIAELEATLTEARELALSEEKTQADAAKKRLKDCEPKIAELKGLLLLRAGQTDEALAELEKAKGMDRFRLAEAYLACGKREKTLEIAREFIKQPPHQVLPPARAAILFEAAGENDEAAQAFEQLRKLAADVDLDAPLFTRLAPLAERLKLSTDWRIARTAGDDLGERPDLATLGPFRWQPSPASSWTLQDHQGRESSLATFAGRPVIVVFYLGSGCLHCVEQLHKLSPHSKSFADAGMEIVAISTETPAELQQAVAEFTTENQPIPFPLLSNEPHDVFRAYRCYDDFEQQPLHGTVLIDAQGRVRWQDTGHEPFMDVEFLLRESQRLLGQK